MGEVEELTDILKDRVDDYTLSQLEENLMLLDEAGNSFDLEAVKAGKQTPVFSEVQSQVSVCQHFWNTI
ncbi:peptide chain release factor 3 [Sporolactobacillus inulinus]|uniref:Peptide chain release factor 3 n=1 Tax=Sporolactobacillus inulinus TaxID=2078 RepID=A0A4Y1Z8J3_9BACL|nr:peptide chain release factor 3 [Sporolactobacillus inulinus]